MGGRGSEGTQCANSRDSDRTGFTYLHGWGRRKGQPGPTGAAAEHSWWWKRLSFTSVTTFGDSLQGQRARHQSPRTRCCAHARRTPTGLSGGEGLRTEIKKGEVRKENKVFRRSLGQRIPFKTWGEDKRPCSHSWRRETKSGGGM